MNENILTVIIPIYNTEMTLERCLLSVLNQSLKDIKIILIDDNSNDNSYKIIEKYKKEYNNIDYYKNETNMGAGYSRNQGIEKTESKYICFLDSDDWVDSNSYKESIALLENHKECDIAIWGIKTEYNNISCSTIRYEYKHFNIIESNFALSLLCHTNNQDVYISPLLGSKMFRTETIKKNHIRFNSSYFEDDIFTFQMIFSANKLALIPNIYLHYYQRDNSIMHSFSKQYIDDLIDSFCIIKDYLSEKNVYKERQKDFYAFFDKCYISMLNILFSVEAEVDIQKKYIYYFAQRFENAFSLEEYIDYLDIKRIKQIMLLN